MKTTGILYFYLNDWHLCNGKGHTVCGWADDLADKVITGGSITCVDCKKTITDLIGLLPSYGKLKTK